MAEFTLPKNSQIDKKAGKLYKAKERGRNQVAYPISTMSTKTDSVTQEEKSALFGAVDNSQ